MYFYCLFLFDVSFILVVVSVFGRLIFEMLILEEFRFFYFYCNNGENDENILKGEEIEVIFGYFWEVFFL